MIRSVGYETGNPHQIRPCASRFKRDGKKPLQRQAIKATGCRA